MAGLILPGRLINRAHHAFAHVRISANHGLDLARLDAESANLDLFVNAPGNFKYAIGSVASHITRSIEALAGMLAERIRHEGFRRQLRLIDVAAPDAVAADMQLTPNADWNRAVRCVQHISLRVGDRPADWNDGRFILTGRNGIYHHNPGGFRL